MLEFQKDWGAKIAPGVAASGMSTKVSDDGERRKLFRTAPGQGDTVKNPTGEPIKEGAPANWGDDKRFMSTNYIPFPGETTPATFVTNTLNKMICGSANGKSSYPVVPDCILSERSIILDPAFKQLRAGGVFQPRGGDELKYAEKGEARQCGPRDLVEAARIMRQIGSHIIIGATIGGETTTTFDVSTTKTHQHSATSSGGGAGGGDSGSGDDTTDPGDEDLISTQVQTLLRKARERLSKGSSASRSREFGEMSDMAQMQSISENPSLSSVLSNDPVRSMQVWEAELEENRMDVAQRDAAARANRNDHSGEDPFNPFASLAPPREIFASKSGRNRRRRRRRRRLLHKVQKPQQIDYGDADLMDTPRRVLGGTHMPRSAMDENDRDLSMFWQSVDAFPGIVNLRIRPLLDLIHHADVQKSCFVTFALKKHGQLFDFLKEVREKHLVIKEARRMKECSKAYSGCARYKLGHVISEELMKNQRKEEKEVTQEYMAVRLVF